MIDLKELSSSSAIIRLGMHLSRLAPQGAAHQLNWWVSGALGRFKPAIYRIVEANLSQVLGPDATRTTLAETTRQVFYYTLCSYYDLFRAIRLPLAEMRALVDVSEETIEIARSLRGREGGAILVFPHLGSFDICGHAIVPYLPEMQLITLPDPPAGFQLLNETRKRSGVHVTPLTPAALRQALRLLKKGGVLTMAGDRPVSNLDAPVPFFGRPARVPSGHVRLALNTGAALVVGHCILSPDTQRYAIHLDPPLELVRTGDREEETVINLQHVLDRLQDSIRRWPGQWQMFVPVWPDPLEA